MMKRIPLAMAAAIGLICLLLAAPNESFAQKFEDLPASVKTTVNERMDEGDKVNRVQRVTILGERGYDIRLSRPGRLNLNLWIRPDGRLYDLYENGQIRTGHEQLMREDDPWAIRTIYTPEAGNPYISKGEFYGYFFGVSDVGGTCLAFDLYGFNSDGTELAPESVKHVNWIAGELRDYWTGGVCRVFGPGSPEDAEGRLNAVKTAAKAFRNYASSIVFWIDGPDARSLAEEMKALAPNLCIAAPDFEIDFAAYIPSYSPGSPTLIFGQQPSDRSKHMHYILTPNNASYAMLESANRYPDESDEWNAGTDSLSQAEKDAGFVSLFDGESFDGWTILGSNKNGFIIRDNEIHWVKSGASALQSWKRYGNYTLRLEYKIEENGNSGLQLRTPRANRASRIGFEFQLYGDHGKAPTKHSTGAVYDVLAASVNASKPAGEWNQLEVTLDGPRLKAVLNGKTVQDISFDDYDELKHRLRKGFIRLQDHGNYVAFRKIRIKEL